VLESFFDYYELEKAQKDLQNLVQIGLTTDNDTYDTGSKRNNLLHLQQYLLKLMEAAYIQLTIPAD
jgi:hypothetical protein